MSKNTRFQRGLLPALTGLLLLGAAWLFTVDGWPGSQEEPEALPPSGLETPGLAGGQTADLEPLSASEPRPLRPDQPEPTTDLERRLAQLAYEGEVEARVAAAEALAEWVPGEAEQGLAQAAAHDESPRVREAALRSLEDAGSAGTLALFAQALADPDLWVQDAGETGLYRAPDRQRARSELAHLCLSQDREVRLRAADLLDEMEAGQLPWDELYAGPVQLPWLAAPPASTDDPDDR